MITKVTNRDTNETTHYFSGKPFSENQITQLTNIGCKVDHVPSYVSRGTGVQIAQAEFTVVKTTTEKQEIILKLMKAP
jgi:hypothetical protein